MTHLPTATLYALGAALLFGASTPAAKWLAEFGLPQSPFTLAGLLYLGSGLGLAGVRLLRDRGWQPSGVQRHEWPRLLGAIGFGGVVAPVLLMLGLAHSTASTASLLLNLEAVLTALLAWLVFKEATDRRIVLGMALIVAGGVVLVWPADAVRVTDWVGSAVLAGACLAWAIDNNLTRQVAGAGCIHTGRLVATGHHFVGGLPGLRPESGAVCAGLARLGHGAHGCLFLNRSVCRCGTVDALAG